MFGLKKKEEKRAKLVAVADGKLIPIEKVKDPVFSKKMMGDGFVIETTSNVIYACADASVTVLFPSNHAVGLTLDDGMELLIHVGIDTVNEEGKGFTCLTKQGMHVKKGEMLMQFDRDYLLEKGYDLTTVVVFTNKDTYKEFTCENCVDVIGGEDVVVTYTI